MIDKHLILATFLQKPLVNIKVRARNIGTSCVELGGRYYYFDKDNNLQFTSSKSPDMRSKADIYLRKTTIRGAKEANSGENFKRFEFDDGSQIILNSMEGIEYEDKQIKDVSKKESDKE